MTKRILAATAAATLLLAACGGDDDGGGSPQDQVADMMIDAINEEFEGQDLEGVSIDEDCVRDATGELSDDDAQKILDAGPEGDPEGLSTSAEAAAASLLDCVEIDFSAIDG